MPTQKATATTDDPATSPCLWLWALLNSSPGPPPSFGVNLVGMTVAGVATLLTQRALRRTIRTRRTNAGPPHHPVSARRSAHSFGEEVQHELVELAGPFDRQDV